MKKTLSNKIRGISAALLLTALGLSSQAMFMPPQPTPLDRLIKGAEAFIEKNPKNAEAHYTLGRIHYLAFHLKRDTIPAFGSRGNDNQLPRVAPQWMVGWGEREKIAKPLPSKELVTHASKALTHFKEALKLKEKDGLTQLGIASLREEFLAWAKTEKPEGLPEELSEINLTMVRADYAKALEFSLKEDAKLTHQPVAGLGSITSHEAATAIVRLAQGAEDKLSETEQKDLRAAQKAVEHFKTLQMGPVTPLVFSFQPAERLEKLLAPETTVDFDLRGYGPREKWTWIKPELGLLVWDPLRTGKIESARQLFGGYTFEIFRANGYDALAALDDNRDGVLSGSELDGISAWFDRNSDGVSSPGEVTPLRDLGIVSIAVKMDGHDGIHPTSARGITLRDGRTLRTWDWMTEPAAQAPAAGIASAK